MKTAFFTKLAVLLVLAPTILVHSPMATAQEENATDQNEFARGSTEVKVNAVWFAKGPKGYTGGVAPVSIRVFPNFSKTASIGVMEEFYNGTGEMWRTATWIAAFNAARVNDSTIVDHEFLVKVSGHIDGPSAGMLTTVGMLASIRGDKIKANTAMTGTINPDGTAGTVGGIPQKMDGAQKAGIERFGYPVGCRSSRDYETNEVVDLNARADDLGMEAKEIRDIYEAYEFMTGVRLKRPQAVYESDMDLSTSLRTKVEGWSLRTESQLKDRIAKIFANAKRNELVKKMLDTMLTKLDKAFVEAQEFQNSSLSVAAYYRYMECDSMARALEAMIDVLPAFAGGDPSALDKHLARVNRTTLTKLKAFQLQVRGSLQNERLGGRIDAINNMNQYAQGAAFFQMAEKSNIEFSALLKNFEKLKEQGREEFAIQQLTFKFVFSCLYYEMAAVSAEYAEDWLTMDSNLGEKIDIDPAKFDALAKAYASAGSSCLSYFDALITQQEAKAAGVSFATMQETLSFNDTLYPFARSLANYSEYSYSLFNTKNKLESALFKLGSGSEAYIVSAGIVNKYYSLRAKMQPDGTVSIKNKKVIGVMLQRARQRALEEAGNLNEKHGFIPDSVKVNFQLASSLREGDDNDKLNALSAYWRAAYLCDLATTMTRK